MIDYTTLSDDALAALIAEHQAIVDEHQEVIDYAQAEINDRKQAQREAAIAESMRYLDEATDYLTSHGYTLERQQHKGFDLYTYAFYPSGTSLSAYDFTRGQKADEAYCLTVCAMSILGNLRVWHEQREAAR